MIRLARPELGTDELDAIRAVLESGFLVQGERVAALEAAVAARVGADHAVAVSSGTAALHLSLLATGIGPGDEVIVPDYTFVATANAVRVVGANPVLVDVEADTLNIDPESVRKAVTGKTRAILPVHQFGLPAAVDALAEHDAIVIEDAACAIGADCGRAGALTTFSFHPRKLVTTAEGGVITTNDAALAEQLRTLRNHGQHGGRVEMPGLNYRMSEIHAAIGCVQMGKLDGFIEKRRALAARYREQLPDLTHPPEAGHVFQSYVVVLAEGRARTEVAAALRTAGIECGAGTTRIGAQPAYAEFARECPVSEMLDERALSLPMHTQLTLEDVDRVSEALRREHG